MLAILVCVVIECVKPDEINPEINEEVDK